MRLSCLKGRLEAGNAVSGMSYSGTLLLSGGFNVDVVYRAIDGTRQPLVHPVGAVVSQILPTRHTG